MTDRYESSDSTYLHVSSREAELRWISSHSCELFLNYVDSLCINYNGGEYSKLFRLRNDELEIRKNMALKKSEDILVILMFCIDIINVEDINV